MVSRRKIPYIALTLSSLYGAGLLLATGVFASGTCTGSTCLDSADGLGIPQVGITNAFTGVIDIMSFVAGVLSAIFIVISGIRYASSAGNSKQLEAAKKTLTYAIIGVIISILAPVIVGFVTAKAP